MRKFNTMAFLMFLALPSALFGQAASFTAAVDKNSVATDEQFTLQFILNGSGLSGEKNFSLPDLSRFLILSGPNQSSSMQFINGAVSSSVTYTYALQPREPGKFTIGPASIEVGGKQYSSEPIEITVAKGSAKPKQQPSAKQAFDPTVQVGDNLFLKTTVDRSRLFVGEQVTASYYLYTRVSITNVSYKKLPSVVGFWGEVLSEAKQLNYGVEVVNGKQYHVALLRKMALFPTQAGVLEVNPLEASCQVQVQNRGRSSDWFDQLFNDPFFNNFSTSNVDVKSSSLKVTVVPLPKGGVPASFKGAVGQFTLNASVSSKSVKTNEPLSLKAVINGAGNIKILEAPNVEIPSEFEKYDPKVTETIERSGKNITGSKTFEWLLVPRYPGQKKIQPLEFSYFDPSKGKYVVLHSNTIDLAVEKGSAEAAQTVAGISKEDVKLLSQDIRFIKTNGTSFRKKGGEEISTPTLVVMTMLPLLAFVGLAAYRQKNLREVSDVAMFRSRKAMKVATKRLKQAKLLLSGTDPEAFYAEISRALWSYVSDRLGIDRADLSIDSVTRQLEVKSISGDLITRLKECLEACEFARFAPASSKQEEKRKIYDLADAVIVATEKELSRL